MDESISSSAAPDVTCGPVLNGRDFDFDYWHTLSRENPAEFERMREQAVQALLMTFQPESKRTLGILWRLDVEKQRKTSPSQMLEWLGKEMMVNLQRLKETCGQLAIK